MNNYASHGAPKWPHIFISACGVPCSRAEVAGREGVRGSGGSISSDVSRGLASLNRSIRGSAETAACQWERAPESRTRSRAASSNPPPSISANGKPVGGTRGGGPGPGPLPHKAATGRGHSSRSGRRTTNELVTFTAGRGGGLAPPARSEGETSFPSAFLWTPNSISSRAKMLRPHSFFIFFSPTTSLPGLGVPKHSMGI